MNGLRLYTRYVRMHFRANLQYKGWPVQLFMVMFHVATDPIEVLFMFARFGALGEWTSARIMLMYALAVTSFGLAELFARGLDYFPLLVRNGEFDRILLRPRATLLQAMALRFHMHRISRVVGGLVMIALSLSALNKRLSVSDAIMLLAALAGGFLTYAGVFLIASAVSFYTIQSMDLIYIFTNGSYQVAKVAPKMLPEWLRALFTYIVPMLPFCYLPAAAVCGWGENYMLGFLALPAGAAFFALACLAWTRGMRHYKSAGS